MVLFFIILGFVIIDIGLAMIFIYEVKFEYLDESETISIKYWNWSRNKRLETLIHL